MANANKANITKRSALNRALSVAEGDQNFTELVNIIEDYNLLQSSAEGEGASLINTESDNSVQDELDGRTRYIPSIAALRASSGLSGNIFVQGYYGEGTDGGGNFYLDESDTTTADDDGLTIVSADGGRWKRIIEGPLYVTYFGAVGDGVADDTAALLAAKEGAITSGLQVINLGGGDKTYLFSSPIYLFGGLEGITGDGVIGTGFASLPVLKYAGPDNSYAISTTSTPENRTAGEGNPHAFLNGFGIISTTGLNSGINAHLMRQSNLSNLHIQGMKVGLRTGMTWVNTYSDIRIDLCETGWLHDYGDLNASYMHNVQILDNDRGWVFSEDANIRDVEFTGNIEKNSLVGLDFGPEGSHNFKIKAYWEHNGDHIRVSMKSTNPLPCSLNVSDCYFFMQSTATNNSWVHVRNISEKFILTADRVELIGQPASGLIFWDVALSSSANFVVRMEFPVLEYGASFPTTMEPWKRYCYGKELTKTNVPVVGSLFSGTLEHWRTRDGVGRLKGTVGSTYTSGTRQLVDQTNVYPNWMSPTTEVRKLAATATDTVLTFRIEPQGSTYVTIPSNVNEIYVDFRE